MFGRWSRGWEPRSGKVLAGEVVGFYGRTTGLSRWQWIVEYRDDDGVDRRVEAQQVGRFIRWMVAVHQGMTVPLLVHRRSGKVRFDHKHPDINARAAMKRDDARRRGEWEHTLRHGSDDEEPVDWEHVLGHGSDAEQRDD